MKAIICDDDPRCAQECKDLLSAISKKNGMDMTVAIAKSGDQLLLNEKVLADVDLIYLDEHMPGMSGMETARELRKKSIAADIVFYTIDQAKALDAYDVDALHFVVKGETSPEKFEEILLKAYFRSNQRRAEVLTLSCAGDHRNINIRSIRYFEVENRIVSVIYEVSDSEAQRFEFYSPLSKIEEMLFGRGFVRIHRSYLVKKDCILKVSSSSVELVTGEVLPIGRTYRPVEMSCERGR